MCAEHVYVMGAMVGFSFLVKRTHVEVPCPHWWCARQRIMLHVLEHPYCGVGEDS